VSITVKKGGRVGRLLSVGLQKIIENFIQGNFEIVKQAALEVRLNVCPLLIAHLFQHPVRIDGIYMMQSTFPPAVAVYFNRFFIRADNPIFPDAAFGVNFLFVTAVMICRAG
jgi:hypothetical protein